MTGHTRAVDPDFAREVLDALYTYPRKSRLLAWLLWAFLGWAGGHRFYLERYGTAALMLFTGGGGMIWWLVDAALLGGMVRSHNEEQARREREGRPPLGLDFMPPLRREVLAAPPEWAQRWAARGRGRRALRLAGDVLVLLVAGSALGGLLGTDGAGEALVAILTLIGVTMLGGTGSARLSAVPGGRALTRWTHRLRLFYYYNEPGSPPALLLRSVTGAFLAFFRRKDRLEVKFYLQLGIAFTVVFLLFDLVPEVLWPLLTTGQFGLGDLAQLWVRETFMTFFITYAFAAPIGAVLTLYLLVRPTHTVPRILSVFTLVAIALGAAGGSFS